ncbi:ABC transporter substrate-binding protein [Streptomyces sp. NPDC007883]|uniref:ABC transporter substrate-binding protein n=1 Tax=Streptomyces sp. NPDC007883 TaxID=3155116 RepID=UPI0033D4632A
MPSIRLRIFVSCLVLVVAGIGAWRLVPSEDRRTPVTVGTTDEVTSLDPAGAYDAGSWALYGNVFQSLLTFRPGSATPVPDAAESCAFTGLNLQTYRCELREDLTFGNGRRITAQDVKHSFDRVLRIKSEVGPGTLFTTLRSVTATDRSVIFNLRSRDATFPHKIATGAGSIVDRTVYPAGSLREGGTVDGSGPYLLGEYRPGVSATLKPNPAYRGAVTKRGGPVVIRYFEGSEQLAAAWKGRSIDVTHRRLPPSVIAGLVSGKEPVRIDEADSSEIRNLVFNVREGEPFAKRSVRRAVAAVVDRAAIATGVHRATVEPLYSLVPQGISGHSTSFFDAYPRPDPELARELLEKGGVKTPVRFTLAHREDTAAAAEAAELRRQLESTGLFEVRVTAAEWQTFQRGYAAGKYDAYTVGWLPDYPDPDNFVQPLVGRDSTLRSGYRSTRVDRLILSTQQYGDRGRASRDFRSIQDAVAEDVPLVPLWQKKDYVLSIEDVSGSQYLSDGTGIWRLWELGWL